MELSTLSLLSSITPPTLLPQEIAETPPPTSRHAHLLFQRRNNHIVCHMRVEVKLRVQQERDYSGTYHSEISDQSGGNSDVYR